MITINGFHSIKESKNSLLNGFEHDVSNGASLNSFFFLNPPTGITLLSAYVLQRLSKISFIGSHCWGCAPI